MNYDLLSSSAPFLNPNEEALASLLNLRLSWLSYHAFALCTEHILYCLGYSEVRSLGRTHLKGRTRMGGVDLTAIRESELGRSRVVIQLKRYNRVVSRRFVDELRGTMLRLDAAEGILVTTASFSGIAQAAVRDFPGRPVRLIAGKELGRLMLAFRIGVIERTDVATGKRLLEIDEEAFERLESYAKHLQPREKGGKR